VSELKTNYDSSDSAQITT